MLCRCDAHGARFSVLGSGCGSDSAASRRSRCSAVSSNPKHSHARHVRAHAVDRCLRGDVERAAVGVAPGAVGRALGRDDHAQVRAVGLEHPDAGCAGDVEVAQHVQLHAVGRAGLRVVHIGDDATVGQRAVGLHVEGPHMAMGRVVDIQDRLVGREGQAVGALEVVGQQLERAVGEDAIDAVMRLLLLLGLDAIGRVGEVDRAVRFHHHVVGAVQALAAHTRPPR